MTNPKWLIGIATLFVACTLWSGICEGAYLGGTDLNTLFNTLIRLPAPWNPVGVWNWLMNLWAMFWFDYAFFHGDWVIVQTIFQCISLGVVVSYGAALLPTLIAAVGGVLGGITRLLRGGVA